MRIFFSGIVLPEQTIKRLKADSLIDDYETMFYCEIDKAPAKTYSIVKNIDETKNLGSITCVKGEESPFAHLWVGGVPLPGYFVKR